MSSKIEVLTRPGCSGCEQIKKLLSDKKIKFVEHDISTIDGLAMAAWYDNPDTVPQVAVNGILVNFDNFVEGVK